MGLGTSVAYCVREGARSPGSPTRIDFSQPRHRDWRQRLEALAAFASFLIFIYIFFNFQGFGYLLFASKISLSDC